MTLTVHREGTGSRPRRAAARRSGQSSQTERNICWPLCSGRPRASRQSSCASSASTAPTSRRRRTRPSRNCLRPTAAPPLARRPGLRGVLGAAQADAAQMKASSVSTEHLHARRLRPNPARAESARLLQGRGMTRDRILEALQSIRGSQRVTDQNPEGKYQRSSAMAATSLHSPAQANWTRSSAATRRSAASSRSSRAARRTTRS